MELSSAAVTPLVILLFILASGQLTFNVFQIVSFSVLFFLVETFTDRVISPLRSFSVSVIVLALHAMK